MHHRKNGFSHGWEKKGHGIKYRGQGGHHLDPMGLFKIKSRKHKHGRHAANSEHGESIREQGKLVNFHGRERSHPVGTGEPRFQYRSGAKADVNLEKCVLCGKCMQVCPTEAILVNGESIHIDADRCMGCGYCVARCKRGALFLVEAKAAVTS